MAILKRLVDLIQAEPVLFFGSTGLLGEGVTLLVALGVWHLSVGVAAAIVAIEGTLCLIVARSQVSPTVSPPTKPA